ncbi:sensor histidine kinase [Luteimonas sp. R10]|uniref:sensor histidine kinase n=1 Tax=Luteimonas sp. R10 TaxID=3108176 RepID=UPI00308E0568|nr:histidine kinase [Luteimonas sp. R10]
MIEMKLGAAKARTTANTTTVIISSINVNPTHATRWARTPFSRQPMSCRPSIHTCPRDRGEETIAPILHSCQPIAMGGRFQRASGGLRSDQYRSQAVRQAPPAFRYSPYMAIDKNPNPLDALWQAPALIWVVLAGQGLAVVLTLAPPSHAGMLVSFGLTSLTIQWVLLIALGGLYASRHSLAAMPPLHLAYVALVWLVVAACLVCGLLWIMMRDVFPFDPKEWRALLLRIVGISLIVGALGLAAFQNYWKGRQLALRAKQAELDALQARIRPHFLYNTLNTAAILAHQRPGHAEQLLLDLADLFRAALGGTRNISLEEELSLTCRYLEIEKFRFGERLKVGWHVPTKLPDIHLPALSLQPLAENAIKHGVEPSVSGGQIDIWVAAEGGEVAISVRNTIHGTVMPGHHVGQKAVRAQIDAATHGKGRLETSVQGDHYVATLTLPLVNEDCHPADKQEPAT